MKNYDELKAFRFVFVFLSFEASSFVVVVVF